jgi:hypothetical protein
MVLSGSMEVEAGDGETRVFTPGTVLCVTDITGRGHQTRVVGADELLLVWGPIPERCDRGIVKKAVAEPARRCCLTCARMRGAMPGEAKGSRTATP